MNSVDDIITSLGGPTALGRICGFEKNPGARGHDMKTRRSIPVRYWPRIIQAARRKGISGITHRVLTEIHASSSTDFTHYAEDNGVNSPADEGTEQPASSQSEAA